MKITKIEMLRLKGENTVGDQQQLFEAFRIFHGKFGAEFKRVTENDGCFEVFYLLPDESNKRALKKHIARSYPVTEEPVIAFDITGATDLKAIFQEMEEKARKMGGNVARTGGNNNTEGTIVLTFEKPNVCRRFEMWAVEEIR